MVKNSNTTVFPQSIRSFLTRTGETLQMAKKLSTVLFFALFAAGAFAHARPSPKTLPQPELAVTPRTVESYTTITVKDIRDAERYYALCILPDYPKNATLFVESNKPVLNLFTPAHARYSCEVRAWNGTLDSSVPLIVEFEVV